MSIPVLSLSGKVAIVTGGKGGIGRAIALAFAEAGADVAICSRIIEDGKLEKVAEEIRNLGRLSLALQADISRKADVESMVKKVTDELGNIDVLINNAAINPMISIFDTGEDTWDEVMAINVKGYFLCSQAVARLMVKQQKEGTIINMASANGWKALINRSAYCVSKAAVIMLTKVFARELGTYNIRVNAIAPFVTRTPMLEDAFKDPEWVSVRLAGIPLGRFGQTDDITGAALFLASDAANWITGHTLAVDGGYLA